MHHGAACARRPRPRHSSTVCRHKSRLLQSFGRRLSGLRGLQGAAGGVPPSSKGRCAAQPCPTAARGTGRRRRRKARAGLDLLASSTGRRRLAGARLGGCRRGLPRRHPPRRRCARSGPARRPACAGAPAKHAGNTWGVSPGVGDTRAPPLCGHCPLGPAGSFSFRSMAPDRWISGPTPPRDAGPHPKTALSHSNKRFGGSAGHVRRWAGASSPAAAGVRAAGAGGHKVNSPETGGPRQGANYITRIPSAPACEGQPGPGPNRVSPVCRGARHCRGATRDGAPCRTSRGSLKMFRLVPAVPVTQRGPQGRGGVVVRGLPTHRIPSGPSAVPKAIRRYFHGP
jgi:hypothetical protein